MLACGCEWGDKPVMLSSFKFFIEFGFDQVLYIFCSDPKVVAVSIHFKDFKVLTMKVIIPKNHNKLRAFGGWCS